MSEKLSITFNNVPELLEKVEKIKAFAIQNAIKRREELRNRGIKFTELNEYGVAIDIDDLTQDDKVWLNSSYNSMDKFIEELES